MRRGKMREKRNTRGLLEKIAIILLPKLPDFLTGKTNVMNEKLMMRYGMRDHSAKIKEIKIHNLKLYLMVCGGALVLITMFSLNYIDAIDQSPIQKQGDSIYLERPEFNERSKRIAIHVEMEHGKEHIAKETEISVKSKELSDTEKEKLLERYANVLPNLILGENKSLEHITKPLKLYERSDSNGITLQWRSDHPEIISETGEVNWIGLSSTASVHLTCQLKLDDLILEKEIPVTVDKGDRRDFNIILMGKLDRLLEDLSQNKNGEFLKLPTKMAHDIIVTWGKGRDNRILYLAFLLAVLAFVLFHRRYNLLDQEWNRRKEAMQNDFPGFVNKLVLLLNAGLVVTSALSKIAEDYINYKIERKVFYEELWIMQRRVNDTNSSIISEIKEFSQRSGICEFLRFSSILAENMDKGTVLSEKLEAESELLWNSRKKRAEERGRLAETKLTLPLVILLGALVIMTITPAILEM